MANKYLIFFFLVILFAFYFYLITQKTTTTNNNTLTHTKYDSNSETLKELNFLSDESNKKLRELSLLLNDALRSNGQLSCRLSSANDSVSENGGFCSKISGRDKNAYHITDETLAQALSKLLAGKKVASFGDGPGYYKDLLLKYGEVASYDAFDGAPFVEEQTDSIVKFLDLSAPIYHLDKYDWIVCLEVAEHIPNKFESIFIDNLVRHAKEGIVLSWSKVGQIGHGHVNNRDFDYVKSKLEEKGFKHDSQNSELLKTQSSLLWFKSNINVYVKS